MKELSKSGFNNLWAAVSMLVLGTVSVGLRLLIRLSTKLPYALSDALIIASLAMLAVYCAMMINYILNGDGPGTYDLYEIFANIDNGGLLWGKSLLKMIYVADIFFGLSITFIKLSILAFFHSIFSISKRFHLWNYCTAGACIIWLVVYTFLNIFQCRPISALWEEMGSTEYCIPSGKLWLGYEIANFFLDVLVLALPVAMIPRLRLPTAQKWALAGIFLLGGLVCVASIVRMTYIWNPESSEVVYVPNTMLMASVQLGVAILGACLPTYGPLLNVARKGMNKVKLVMGMTVSISWGSRKTSGSRGLITSQDSAGRDLEAAPYYRVGGNGGNLQSTQISRTDDEIHALDDLPSRGIRVQRRVDVSS